MNERHDPIDNDADDESIRQLLREAGTRDLPPAHVMNEVRQAVHAEWREVVKAKRRRSRFVGYGIAASVAIAAIAATLALRLMTATAEPVAQVARVDGALQVALDGAERWRVVKVGERLNVGALLRTDAGTRAALDFGHGVSVRIDDGSLIELKSAQQLALESGAVYVDAVPQSDPQQAPPPSLAIETLYGSVRHLGTQYQVRTQRDGLEISVREGRIEIAGQRGLIQAGAGEQLVLTNDRLDRSAIAATDPRWEWASDIAPVFDIERQPLASFLDWVARETGKHIVYATPEASQRAATLILRGSVRNLPPDQALNAVLATTPFRHLDDATQIRIEL
jgi:ferric-dicitrate binding protein FerR (iron transport regulator)